MKLNNAVTAPLMGLVLSLASPSIAHANDRVVGVGCTEAGTNGLISASQAQRILQLPPNAGVGSLLNIAAPSCYISREYRGPGIPGTDIMAFGADGWGNCYVRVTVVNSIVRRIESICRN